MPPSFDVYRDANPKDTIPIKYATLQDTRDTIKMLERLYKAKRYTHVRIVQVASIMKVRLRLGPDKPSNLALATRYVEFLKERTKLVGAARYAARFRE